MNRRNFLKSLAAIPALAWLKPEEIEDSNTFSGLDAPSIDNPPMTALAPTITQQLAVWNGATWAAFDKSIEFGTEGELYIKGDFLLETSEQEDSNPT